MDPSIGAHFGTAEQARSILANKDQEQKPEGERIMPVYLNLKKPLRTLDADDWADPRLVINVLIGEDMLVGGGTLGISVRSDLSRKGIEALEKISEK